MTLVQTKSIRGSAAFFALLLTATAGSAQDTSGPSGQEFALADASAPGVNDIQPHNVAPPPRAGSRADAVQAASKFSRRRLKPGRTMTGDAPVPV